MKKLKYLLYVIVVVIVIFGIYFRVHYSSQSSSADKLAAQWKQERQSADVSKWIEHGKYVARLSDCVACHTAHNGGKPYAGGLGLKTPFGTIYASNITPDKETGIGNWSDADFIRAVRYGIGQHNLLLYPAMPYNNYVKLSDTDLRDLKAYMDTLPAVKSKIPENTMPFPFNMRIMLAGWNLLYFHDAPYAQAPSATASLERGEYLVEGPGHCSDCHSPKNLFGGDKAGQAYQGETLEHWYAPEITSNGYIGLGSWSVEDIATYLRDGGNKHSFAAGSMASAIHHSTQYMNNADLRAIAIYLKQLPGSDRKAPAPIPASDPQMQAGAKLYVNRCMACHNLKGEGVKQMISSFAGSPTAQAPAGGNMIRTVLLGSQGAITNHNPTGAAMPDFGWQLSDEEIADVLTYVRNSWGNAASRITADQVAQARKELLARSPLSNP